MSTRNPCEVEKDELPPGWTVEIRVRRSNGGARKRRTDKYYVDPETGRSFCSMKQVLRYLETGDITKRKSRKTHLVDFKLGETPSVAVEDLNKRVYGITTRRRALQCQVNKDRHTKLHSDCETIRALDRKAKEKITEGTVKRCGTFTEDTQQDERTDDDSRFLPSTQAKVPKTSTLINENLTSDNGKDNHNDEKEGAVLELALVQVDELKEKRMNNQTHEVSVLRLSKGNVEFDKSLKGMHDSEVHIREEQIRDVLKNLQGPVLVPAGYVPLPPCHHIGSSCSINDGMAVRPVDTPPTRAIPAGGDTAVNDGCPPFNNLPSTSNSALPNRDVWDDPCFDFAVRILASEYKLAGDPPGVPSSFQHGFNSSIAQ